MGLRPPATGTEEYLAAILAELQALNARLGEGGGPVRPEPAPDPPHAVSSPQQSGTKRTRTRTRGAGHDQS